jgi:protein involved in sex pheromone biosynthesis
MGVKSHFLERDVLHRSNSEESVLGGMPIKLQAACSMNNLAEGTGKNFWRC